MIDLHGTPTDDMEHEQSHNKQHDGMRDLARRVERHHTMPFRQAEPPPGEPFPRLVIATLAGGSALGGVLGLIFGWLLRRGTIVIGGWEGLFSLEPASFYVFWTFAGIALGALVVGVIGILASPGPSEPPPKSMEE